ncbi:hypothetical protein HZA97_05335 [Candidatus Woesearchaeota archaeon]|nr:hypothetical protein [Candidatus Woesearchaeota archaeon]
MVNGKVKFLGVMALLGVLGYGGCHVVASSVSEEGMKSGVVNTFYKKGLVSLMSGEGKMSIEGTMPTETFTFSVDPWQNHGENFNDLVAKLKDALKSKKPVTVEYVRPYHGFWYMGSTDYFVTGVEPSETTQTVPTQPATPNQTQNGQ